MMIMLLLFASATKRHFDVSIISENIQRVLASLVISFG